MGWTSTDLLARIRLNARLSYAHPDYTDAVLMDKADGILAARFIPTILAVKEDYYARYIDRALVANRQGYTFPARAYGVTLREVEYVGATADDTYRLRQGDYADRLAYAGETGSKPELYVVEDDRVLLLPTPSVAVGSIRMCYEYRPGLLVATTAVCTITGITNIATGVLDCVPVSGWTTDNRFDIVKNVPPYALVDLDLVASTVGGASITFSSTLDASRIEVNDIISLGGYTKYPGIPVELHPALALAVSAEVLEELGDTESALIKEQKVASALQAFSDRIGRRVKEPVKKIVNKSSILRGRIFGAGSTGLDDGLP